MKKIKEVENVIDSEGSIINDQYFDSEGLMVPVTTDQSLTLQSIGDDLTAKIILEDNPDELSKLTQLFTVNQKKKQIARVNKLSNLLDKVDDEVVSRITERPYAIEDRDLLKYWSTTSDAVNGKSEDNDIPRIQINSQTNINVNQTGLNRESREKVLDIVNKLLKEANNNVIDADVKEIK